MPARTNRPKRKKKGKRGFASMDPATATRVHRLGGLAVASDRAHMAEIGRLGGSRGRGSRKPGSGKPS